MWTDWSIGNQYPFSSSMSGRGGRNSGRGGHGNNERSGRGRGRGQHYTGARGASKNGLCGNNGKGKPFDKECWKDKECFNCKKIGHPASHCPKDDDDKDAKSSSSQARSVKKLAKQFRSTKKAFTQLLEKKLAKQFKSMKKAFLRNYKR
jgi:hypothetical protein